MNFDKTDRRQKFLLALSLCAATVLLRLFPLAPNFTPMTALALFAITFFGFGYQSFLFIFATQIFGDLVLALQHGDMEYAFHSGLLGVYGSWFLIGLMGYLLSRKLTLGSSVGFGLAASILFFLVTNFQYWLSADSEYTKNWKGLMECYTAALPFYRTMGASALIFSVLFYVLAVLPVTESSAEKNSN
jgi:hypothetical protein